MTVYVDNAFEIIAVPKKWDGGGHLQADTDEELHEFAAKLGLKRSWFQEKKDCPWHNHYDLTANKRRQAIELGAVDEDAFGEGPIRREQSRREREGTWPK